MGNTQDWFNLSGYLQEIRLFSRIASYRRNALSVSIGELDFLSRIYLNGRSVTPLALSQKMGIQKESVSRMVKKLTALKLVAKEQNPLDERSYSLSLTEQGEAVLADCYQTMLRPVAFLMEKMGRERFLSFIADLSSASSILQDFYKMQKEDV